MDRKRGSINLRYFLICLLCFAFAAPSYAQQNLDDDLVFRGFIWGLSKETIKENEKATFMSEEEDKLFFLDIIDGRRSTIGYEFLNNKLWRTKIFVEKTYYNPQDRIDDLLSIQEKITQKFGAPTEENFQWFDKSQINDFYGWGWAVYRAELVMTSVWQKGNTEVQTYLGAKEKFLPNLIVTYTHIPTKTLYEKEQLKAP